MDDDLTKQIRSSRRRLGNQYAYLNDCGQFDAVPANLGKDVREIRRALRNPYALLDGDGEYSQVVGSIAKDRDCSLIDVTSLVRITNREGRRSRSDIELIVRRLQNKIWSQRSRVLSGGEESNVRDVLSPLLALKCIGYSPRLVDSLGQYSQDGEHFEVAGIIDRPDFSVEISRRFSNEIQKFTAAHELGHAILHEGTGLHRDRALDGTAIGSTRRTEEWEADVFAVFFLMPGKQVRQAFEQTFRCTQFVLNEATAFALTGNSLSTIERTCTTERDLSRMLASAENFDGDHFFSLARQFGVSVETMAIRLEELKVLRR